MDIILLRWVVIVIKIGLWWGSFVGLIVGRYLILVYILCLLLFRCFIKLLINVVLFVLWVLLIKNILWFDLLINWVIFDELFGFGRVIEFWMFVINWLSKVFWIKLFLLVFFGRLGVNRLIIIIVVFWFFICVFLVIFIFIFILI